MSRKFAIDETPFYRSVANYAVEKLLKGIRPILTEDIVGWCENNIDLSFDHTASATGLIKLYPYQREILRACDDPSVQEVTLQMGQRLGKSQCWKMSMIKRVHDGGLSGLIVYPSLELGERTNKDTVMPLLCSIPEVNKDLSQRGNKMKNSYHMPSAQSVIYFLGGGSQIISATANWCVLDESDFIELQNSDDESKNMAQIKALRLRMQSFKQRMLIVCSSPSQFGGVVHQNWKRGSMGEWNLRCLKCGELSPVKQLAFYVESTKSFAGLQWRKNENGEVIEDSIRWICPHCLHEHTYEDAIKMNELGEFKHLRPSNTLHRSFQVGALANPQLWTWREIAQAQEDAVDGDGKKYLANTICGVPYRHRAEGDMSVSIEEANRGRQIEYPKDMEDRLAIITMGVDQQKSELAGTKYFVSVVRGWDEAGNSYLLSAGTDNTLEDVRKRLTTAYFGKHVSLCMIDNGGFDNSQDVDPFVEANPQVVYYKGTDVKYLDGKDFKLSENIKKLFLCNALGYQCKLLDLLYSPKRANGYGWYLPPVVDDEYFKQLCNVQPNTRMGKDSNGYEYVNWHAFGGARRDAFDAEKMALCAMYVACTILPATVFIKHRIPAFIVKERLTSMVRQQKLGRMAQK